MDKTKEYIGEKRTSFKDSVFTYDNYTIYFYDSDSPLRAEFVSQHDAAIIDARDFEHAKIIVKRIRSSNDPLIYLKPVFLINYKDHYDKALTELTDGTLLSFDQIPEKVNDIKNIKTHILQLDISEGKSFEVQIFKKVLDYLFTREERTLAPIPDPTSFIGFTYPVVSVNFEPYEEYMVLDILDWALNEDYIWPDYFDRVYLCNQCKSMHVSMRETCPSCQSSQLKPEDLVHHFSCGYIGPISDFKNKIDGTLSCPKCSKNLRHIGVDYDKPSLINQCLDCNEVFQDYKVKARCLNCKNDVEVQYLLAKDLNVFKLTKKGRNAAITGISESEIELEKSVLNTVNFNTFNTMMHYERQRMKSNPLLKACIAVIILDNVHEIYKNVGKNNERMLLVDIAQILRDNISPADIISFQNNTTVVMNINDEDLAVAQLMTERAIQKLENIIANNFDNFILKTKYKVIGLRIDKSFESQFKEVTKQLADQ
ncbi:MAG: hypothetical protein K0S32_1648 [Bacteroidetes bacterium]|jgi:GGDEF domain-containing protein|nr:hypothetical protein [Bacteroidota bacterium]